MALYAKDKCTPEQLEIFAVEVRDWLKSNGLAEFKTRKSRSYGGHIAIYSGHVAEIQNSRVSYRKTDDDGVRLRGKFKQRVIEAEYLYLEEWQDFLTDEDEQDNLISALQHGKRLSEME